MEDSFMIETSKMEKFICIDVLKCCQRCGYGKARVSMTDAKVEFTLPPAMFLSYLCA